MIKGRTGGDSKFVGGQKRSLQGMGRSLVGGKARGKPWEERLLGRQEPSQMWGDVKELVMEKHPSVSAPTYSLGTSLGGGQTFQVAGSRV